MAVIIIKMKINEKIEAYRSDTGTTRSWVAKQMGMSIQRLNQIVNGNNITLKLLIKFATFLRCEVSDLYEYNVTNY